MSEYGSASASFSVSGRNTAPLASVENSSILAYGHLTSQELPKSDENDLHSKGASHETKASYLPTEVSGLRPATFDDASPRCSKDIYIDIDISSGSSDAAIDSTEPIKSSFPYSLVAHLISSNDTEYTTDSLSASNIDTSSIALTPFNSTEDLPSLTASTKPGKVQPTPNSPLLPTSFKAPTPAVVKSESSCCRICQEGKSEEPLISPCYCSGTMGKVHLSCVETWLQLMHRSSCELCQYEFPVERIPQPTYKFFLNPGSSTEFANLMCDIACFLILTPLLIITMFLCTRGVKYYDQHGKTGSMFAVVTLIGSLLVVYVSWAVLAFLYHYRIWRTWRENTAVIRMSLEKGPKTEVKTTKNESDGKKLKNADKKGTKRGNDTSQACNAGTKRASSSDFVYPGYDSRRRLLGGAPAGKCFANNSLGRNVKIDDTQASTQAAVAGGDERCQGTRKHQHPQKVPNITKHQETQNMEQMINFFQESGYDIFISPKFNTKKKHGNGKHGRRTKELTLKQKDKVTGFETMPKVKAPNLPAQAIDTGCPSAKENFSKKNSRLGTEKPASHSKPPDKLPATLGDTVSFDIEPSNPAHLVGFRFLDN